MLRCHDLQKYFRRDFVVVVVFFFENSYFVRTFLLSRFYGQKSWSFLWFFIEVVFLVLEKIRAPFLLGLLEAPKKWRWTLGWLGTWHCWCLVDWWSFLALKANNKTNCVLLTRWAPSRSLFFWSYGAPKSMAKNKWVTWFSISTLLVRVVTPFITGRGPPSS